MTRAKSLSLGIPKSPSPISSTLTSPTDPGSVASSPSGPNAVGSTHSPRRLPSVDRPRPQTSIMYPQQDPQQDPPASPDFTSLPPIPASPKQTPRPLQETSKSFFSNLKASKSSNKVHATTESTIRQVSEEISRSKVDLSDGSVYSRPSPGSTPDLSLPIFDTVDTDSLDRPQAFEPNHLESAIHRRPIAPSPLSNESIGRPYLEGPSLKKPKQRFGNLIGRTRSIRIDEGGTGDSRPAGKISGRKMKPYTPIITGNAPQIKLQHGSPQEQGTPANTPLTPKTAPLPQDRYLRDDRSPAPRNRSAERGNDNGFLLPENRSAHGGASNPSSALFKDGAGSHLFNNIRNTSSRAAGGLNKAGKGIMAKMNRSGGSTNNREEERYVCHVINLPLIEQTRKTHIAERLENSKDKTEFWMPALPWRCIDYLNFRGCEEEGLYRVPGSDREIRAWQKRFDQEGDINLFDEADLYDINVIGSLFKSWLRELPTEIFPKAVQSKIYQAHPDATEVPQLMKDELSLLPPWNYYLLFAITCHLSLLTAYSDKNRMTYSNLVICFQPCLRIDNFCFQFLVQKWRDCWQGCRTEKEALEEEYGIFERGSRRSPSSSGGSSLAGSNPGTSEEKSMAPPSNYQNPPSSGRTQQHRPPPLTLATGTGDLPPSTPSGRPNGHARSESQLPELEPMQPLSPIGL